MFEHHNRWHIWIRFHLRNGQMLPFEALELLHRRAAEERMARSVDDFYGNSEPPLPIGVRPASASERRDATA
ncbi:hypothetical protein [Arthrobacter castelli]|uniref:hypothetical protein n=1 Tax=Arthrobacter castelli TaxID=271431 RepID=UPI000429925F|nr:hypothetical protein [Arthrobacter castelli]